MSEIRHPQTWFTSDHHFGHGNVIKHASRPFFDAAQMDEIMIERWNSRVHPDDDVIHVGDMYWGGELARMKEIRGRLNGRIRLVAGNHDRPMRLLENGLVDEVLPAIHEEWVCDESGKKILFVICHYPMAEWNQFFRGSIHLHGHCHGNAPGQIPTPKNFRRLDISVDCHEFYPLNSEQILKQFS